MADPVASDLAAEATARLRRELALARSNLADYQAANRRLWDLLLDAACTNWNATAGQGGEVQRILHDALVIDYGTDPHTLTTRRDRL